MSRIFHPNFSPQKTLTNAKCPRHCKICWRGLLTDFPPARSRSIIRPQNGSYVDAVPSAGFKFELEHSSVTGLLIPTGPHCGLNLIHRIDNPGGDFSMHLFFSDSVHISFLLAQGFLRRAIVQPTHQASMSCGSSTVASCPAVLLCELLLLCVALASEALLELAPLALCLAALPELFWWLLLPVVPFSSELLLEFELLALDELLCELLLLCVALASEALLELAPLALCFELLALDELLCELLLLCVALASEALLELAPLALCLAALPELFWWLLLPVVPFSSELLLEFELLALDELLCELLLLCVALASEALLELAPLAFCWAVPLWELLLLCIPLCCEALLRLPV